MAVSNTGIRRSLLYGADLIVDFEMPTRLSVLGFSDFEDVKTLESKDFYYSSFKADGYDYLLYSDYANSNYPVLSVFSKDSSELPFICSAVQFEHINLPKWEFPSQSSENKKHTVDSLVQNVDKQNNKEEGEGAKQISKISRIYNFEQKFQYSDSFCQVQVSYSPISLVLVQNCYSRDVLQKLLSKELGKEDTKVRVIEYSKMSSLSPKYFVSFLRACIVALKAASKFKSDIVFTFKPFSIYGPLKIADNLIFDKNDGSITSRELNVSYDLGFSSLYSDKLMQVVHSQTFFEMETCPVVSKVTLTHKYPYNSTLSPENFEKIMQTVNAILFNSLCSALGVNQCNKVEEMMQKVLERDSAKDLKINAFHNFINETKYQMKRSIYQINKSSSTPLASLNNKKQKSIYFYPLIKHSDIFAIIAEIDDFTKRIESVWFLLPNFDKSKHLNKLLNITSIFFTRFGYNINPRINSTSVKCFSYESNFPFDPLSMAVSLLNVFNPVYTLKE